jgi:hypothetical protein
MHPYQPLQPLLEPVDAETRGAAVQMSLDGLNLAGRQLPVQELAE